MLFLKVDKYYILYQSCIDMYKKQHIKFVQLDEQYLTKIVVNLSVFKP